MSCKKTSPPNEYHSCLYEPCVNSEPPKPKEVLKNLDKGAEELEKRYFSLHQDTNRAIKQESRFDFVFFLFIIAGMIFGSWLTTFLS